MKAPHVLVAALALFGAGPLSSCALWRSVEPVVTERGMEFLTCVEAHLPEEVTALIHLDAAAEWQIAKSCLSEAASVSEVEANVPTVHAAARTKAKARVGATPCTGAK